MPTSHLLTTETERRTNEESEVGIILLRSLEMKERPLRDREALTVPHSVTFQKIRIPIITAMETLFSQYKKSFFSSTVFQHLSPFIKPTEWYKRNAPQHQNQPVSFCSWKISLCLQMNSKNIRHFKAIY